MKLCFNVDTSLRTGISRLADLLGFTEGEGGITVTAVLGDRAGVVKNGATAVIYYRKKAEFFRELGVLCEHAEEESFEILEDTAFTELSVMLDTARFGVTTVEAIGRLCDHLVVMGYSALLLYIEDNVKVEGYPYFGYLRGSYTPEELRAIDDYAYEYGIEVIGCIECYGHMGRYLFWGDTSVRDTDQVLLARSEKTFALLDKLIGTFAANLRSRRIHVGMDEAWDMGRGRFMDIHGYVPPEVILAEYMERLSEIVAGHGLHPMMWSDMYFRLNDTSGKRLFYGAKLDDPASVSKQIPEDMTLVYWHYGELYGCDDDMMAYHNAFGRPVIFAGGSWSWCGHFPENYYTEIATSASIAACRRHGIDAAMMTLWLNDGAEGELFANLYALSYMAELCYRAEPTEACLDARFRATTGGDRTFFRELAGYHNKQGGADMYPVYSKRFLGKPIFWQDTLEGLYDSHLIGKDMSAHYAVLAAYYETAPEDRYSYLYRYAVRVFSYLAAKCRVAERLYPAYQAGDTATLRDILEKDLPALLTESRAMHAAHKAVWHVSNKAVGFAVLDRRYAGNTARVESAIERLGGYLAGELDALPELEEPRLNKSLYGFVPFSKIVQQP